MAAPAVPVESHVRSADGTDIGMLTLGRGPAVVFCHGSLATGDDWLPVAFQLASRFTCHLMSRRGRGRSAAGPVHTLQSDCEDLAAVRGAAGAGAHVVGHSYGAICVLETMRRAADAAKLVLYEPPLPIDEPVVGPALSAYRAAIEAGRPEDALLEGFRSFVRLPEDEIAALRKSLMWRQSIKLAPTWLPELEAIAALPLGVERYRSLAAPTLLLEGGATAPHHRVAVAALQRALPAARTATIDGHGHTAHVTAAGRVAAAIAQFLAEP